MPKGYFLRLLKKIKNENTVKLFFTPYSFMSNTVE